MSRQMQEEFDASVRASYGYDVHVELDDAEVCDIITTAVEGGIGYWACLLNGDKSFKAAARRLEAAKKSGSRGDYFWCDIIKEVWDNGDAIRFIDADDTEGGDIWTLNKKKFLKGCELYEKEYGSIRKEMEDGSFDANSADAIFQLATFGEITFG